MEGFYDYFQHTHLIVFGTYQQYITSSTVIMYLHEIGFDEEKAYSDCILNNLIQNHDDYHIK
jgi:hypothetical protein